MTFHNPPILYQGPLVENYGAKGDATADDLAPLNAAKAVSRNLTLKEGASYRITASLDCTDAWGINIKGVGANADPANPFGQGRAATTIKADFSNSPALMLHGQVDVEKLCIFYPTNQARGNTNARGVEIDGVTAGSVLRDITVIGAHTSFGIKQANAPGMAQNTIFASTLDNLISYIPSGTHFDFRNYSGGGTNIIFPNLYMNGGNAVDWSTQGFACQYGLRMHTFSGLKLGTMSCDGQNFDEIPIYLQDCTGELDLVRFETCKVKKNGGAWVELGGDVCGLHIRELEIRNSKMLAADGITTGTILRVVGNEVDVEIDHLYIDDQCQFNIDFCGILDAGFCEGNIKIHRITNRTAQASNNGVINTFVDRSDGKNVVEIFDGKRIFERIRSNNASQETVRYFRDETRAPGGANYHITKVWEPWAEIVVMNPTGVGWPKVWYTPGGGANPADWRPMEYYGGENGSLGIADADYTFAPYIGYQTLDHYTATANRNVTLGVGAAPRAIKDGVTIRLVNHSGQTWQVKDQAGANWFLMTNNTWAVVSYQSSQWIKWASGAI